MRAIAIYLLLIGICSLVNSAQAQLGAKGAQFISRSELSNVLDPGFAIPASQEPSSMASGDLNNDGIDDLVIGWFGMSFSGPDLREKVGGVIILYGSDSGLSRSASQQRFIAPTGQLTTDDQFGAAVAVGSVTSQGPSLAVGAPGDRGSKGVGGGTFTVFYSDANGINETLFDTINQSLDGLIGTEEAEDRFGGYLAFGDFDNNNSDDLIVSMTREAIGSIEGPARSTMTDATISPSAFSRKTSTETPPFGAVRSM